MNRWGLIILFWLPVAMADSLDFSQLLAQAQSKVASYQPPSVAKIDTCRQLFRQLLTQGYSDGLAQAWSNQGFSLTATENWLIVQEPHNTGQGLYVIARKPPISPVYFLQAPHSFKDIYTGKIAAKLMQTGQFYAAAWNTVPRYGRQAQDLAHISQSVFQAFADALIEQQPQTWLIQLHGFSNNARKTLLGQQMDMIVSATENHTPVWLRQLADSLNQVWPDKTIGVYPQTVNELGGTTNANAQQLKRAGFHQFLHMEMNLELRNSLLKNNQLRQQLIGSLQQNLP